MYDKVFGELLELLQPLERVSQSPRHHPEGNALFHSLQVYERAKEGTDDPVLWAAALLHDVGKAVVSPCHAETGADLLDGLVNERVQWLVARHLDLLRSQREVRSLMAGDLRLRDLEALRHWDLSGRCPHALVVPAERALGELLEPGTAEAWLCPSLTDEDDFELTV